MAQQTTYTCDPAKWIEAYSDELYRFTYSRTGNREEAEDIVQETFFSALKNLEGFRRDCAEKTWLYNILKNKIVDFYRKKARQSDIGLQVEGDDDFYNQFFSNNGKSKGFWLETGMPKPWEKTADQDINNEEFMKVMTHCLNKLPELWVAVFSLKNMDDRSSDEICKELDITSSNLWVIIHRAKLQLRACLEKNWFNQ